MSGAVWAKQREAEAVDHCLGYSLFCVDARVAIQSHKHFLQFDTVLVHRIH